MLDIPPRRRLDRPTAIAGSRSEADVDGYRVDIARVTLDGPVGGDVIVQYGPPALRRATPTIARVELLLVLGVLAGTRSRCSPG